MKEQVRTISRQTKKRQILAYGGMVPRKKVETKSPQDSAYLDVTLIGPHDDKVLAQHSTELQRLHDHFVRLANQVK